MNNRRLALPIADGNTASQKEVVKLNGIRKILPFVALLAPLLLMALGTIFSGDNPIINFIKNPVWALMTGVAFALPLLGKDNFSKTLNDYFQTLGLNRQW